jgi:hypothetical protein
MAVFEDELLLPPFEITETPGSRVFHAPRPYLTVRLWGRLSPFWADNFTLGLSGLSLNISHGFARQDGSGLWGAEFLIAPTSGAPDPMAVDYLMLAETEPAEKYAGPVVLDDYVLTAPPDGGAALRLEVRAADRIGFLGSLLRCLSHVSLFPQEMAIGTSEGQIVDRFELKAAGNVTPSEEARRALGRMLDGMLRGRRAGAQAFF